MSISGLSKSSYFVNESVKEFITESINIKEEETIDVAILFTDMVASSKAWKQNPMKMIEMIEDHSKIIDRNSKTK